MAGDNLKPPAPLKHILRGGLAPVASKPARRAPPTIGRYVTGIFSDLARQTRFVDPNLAVDWPRIVGAELGGLCRPGRLSGGRLGRSLEVYAASGAAASRVQFEAEALRRRVNEYLGPGVVGRIVVRQAGGPSEGGLESALGRFRAAVKAKTREK
jgi:hypothetical protein